MIRHNINPRPDWQTTANDIGFTFFNNGIDGDGTLWNENVAYEFTSGEVDELDDATEALHEMSLKVVDHIVSNDNLMMNLDIPDKFHDMIKNSWRNKEPSLYGRFDLSYDGKSPPKMLEYNADTPTLVIETSLMQWTWLQQVMPNCDQFNSFHEKMLDRFKYIRTLVPVNETFYFIGYPGLEEEFRTLEYLEDLAQQTNLKTRFISIHDVGSNGTNFYDLYNNVIKFWFKLYPWEWMMREEFSDTLLKSNNGILEPIWKSILSNKGFLPIMYELFPDSPYILPAFFDENKISGDYVVKPILSREGANINMISGGKSICQTDGDYGNGRNVYQKTANLFCQDGNYAVIGSWIIGNKSAGIVMRDSRSPIIRSNSSVVPHYFK